MPIYEIECVQCGTVSEKYSTLPTDESFSCPRCGGDTKRLYSLFSAKFFQCFTTNNILPDGSPITVTSQKQLSSLCNRYNLNHVDDPKWQSPSQRFKTAGEILGKPELQEDHRDVDSGGAAPQSALQQGGV